MKEAEYYELLENGNIKCRLCPHNCLIADGGTGICSVRKNSNSKLITEIYGRVTSIAVDPIEKKPLYHFYPSSRILSIGTKGCNLKCPYCQNWRISQDLSAHTSYYSPEEIIESALEKNSIGIAYTYSEPVIWIEYALDCAKLAREKNLKNVMVTNGFINEEPLMDLIDYTDAMNVDLKTFNEETYRKFLKGKLGDVLNTIKTAHENGCSVEITTLIVSGMNDEINEMKDIINFISSIDESIPWHISRYYPNYKYEKPATGIDFMMEVYKEAVKKLKYVYSGNISSSYDGSDTICPSCKEIVVSRSGYFIKIDNLENGKCKKCGADIGIKQ